MTDEPASEQTALDYLICVRDDLRAQEQQAEERLRTLWSDHAEAQRQSALASERISKMERLLNPLRKVSPATMEFKLEMSGPLAERVREYMQACRVVTARPKVLEPGIAIARDTLDGYRRALEDVELLLATALPTPAPAVADDDEAIVGEDASSMEEAG